MSRYGIRKDSLFAFLEQHYPATFISFNSVEPGENESTVIFRAETIRYYSQIEPAGDFEKHGYNPCEPGRWSTEESEEYKYKAVHTDFINVTLDNDTWAKLGLEVYL